MISAKSIHHYPQEPVANSSVLVKLSLTRIEVLAPQELGLETGRLLMLLSSAPDGLTKGELVRLFYPDYEGSSPLRQGSLIGCLNKVIQRGRGRFERFGVTFYFCKKEKKWRLVPVESLTKSARPFVNSL